MLRLVLVCLMACAAGKAANGARREVTFAGTPPCDSQHCSVMWFDHGFLFSSGDPTQGPRELLSAWDRSGRLVYEARIGFPDGTPSNIGIGAADGDGTVAMPVFDSDSNGRGQDRRGGVAILDPRGKQVRFIDTGAFVPGSVCFGEDHSVWVGGFLGAWDYALIRHYSRDGELLGGFFPRSTFPYFSPPAAFAVIWMQAAPGRIGFLTFSGDATYTPEWVEFDRTGRETGRWPSMSDELTPINVLTTDGRLIVSRWRKEAGKSRLLVLDRVRSAWAEQTVVFADGPLLGTDGNDLVFWDRSVDDPAGAHLVWVPAPKD